MLPACAASPSNGRSPSIDRSCGGASSGSGARNVRAATHGGAMRSSTPGSAAAALVEGDEDRGLAGPIGMAREQDGQRSVSHASPVATQQPCMSLHGSGVMKLNSGAGYGAGRTPARRSRRAEGHVTRQRPGRIRRKYAGSCRRRSQARRSSDTRLRHRLRVGLPRRASSKTLRRRWPGRRRTIVMDALRPARRGCDVVRERRVADRRIPAREAAGVRGRGEVRRPEVRITGVETMVLEPDPDDVGGQRAGGRAP